MRSETDERTDGWTDRAGGVFGWVDAFVFIHNAFVPEVPELPKVPEVPEIPEVSEAPEGHRCDCRFDTRALTGSAPG